MQLNKTSIKDLLVAVPEPFADERGWFARIFDNDLFDKAGIPVEWRQVNHSFTKTKGTIRGMHFQRAPYEEVKMVKCISGKVWDVAIDIRRDSPTYLKHFAAILSPENSHMMVIPKGFAHGFQTLEDDSALIYFHSEKYTPGNEGGLRYDDPALAIEWPLPVTVISDRDKNHPLLSIEK